LNWPRPTRILSDIVVLRLRKVVGGNLKKSG
jgi:hypothetical protein